MNSTAGASKRTTEEIPFASVLQDRLLMALDSLDSERKLYREDLKALEHERSNLEARLDRAGHFIQNLRSERDDMRDAVMRLVEKVELCNDYSKWPHSRIALSGFAEPAPMLQATHLDGEELLSNSAILIARLRQQRDEERRAHTRSRDEAASTILSLEAQISRREAQLASCISEHKHDYGSLATSSRTSHLLAKQGSDPAVNILSVLEITTARNKALENEIKTLARRLESAKAQSITPSQPVTQTFGHRAPGSRHDTNRRPEQTQKTGLRPSNTLQGFQSEVQSLAHKIDQFAEERRATSRTLTPVSSSETRTVQELHRVFEVDSRISELQAECRRLRDSGISLQEQLDVTRQDANRREIELRSELAALRHALIVHSPSSHQPDRAHDQRLQETNEVQATFPADFLGEGEAPMELATPLMPTMSTQTRELPEDVITPLAPDLFNSTPSDNHHQNQEDAYFDPPSVPLPPSPDGLSEWEENDNSPTLSQAMISSSAHLFSDPMSRPPN